MYQPNREQDLRAQLDPSSPWQQDAAAATSVGAVTGGRRCARAWAPVRRRPSHHAASTHPPAAVTVVATGCTVEPQPLPPGDVTQPRIGGPGHGRDADDEADEEDGDGEEGEDGADEYIDPANAGPAAVRTFGTNDSFTMGYVYDVRFDDVGALDVGKPVDVTDAEDGAAAVHITLVGEGRIPPTLAACARLLNPFPADSGYDPCAVEVEAVPPVALTGVVTLSFAEPRVVLGQADAFVSYGEDAVGDLAIYGTKRPDDAPDN